MKKGKLIEFRAGLFGINPPNNLGIVIKVITRKKERFYDIYTTKGIREIKKRHISTTRKFSDHIDIPSSMKRKALVKELSPRLEHLIQKYGQTKKERLLSKDKQKAIKSGPSSDRELWDWFRKNNIEIELTSKEIAEKWYKKRATTAKINEIEEVLDVCTSFGVGYFDVIGAKPKRWRPIAFEDYEAATEEISALRSLRKRMIEVEEVEDEDGYTKSVNIPVAIYILDFTGVKAVNNIDIEIS